MDATPATAETANNAPPVAKPAAIDKTPAVIASHMDAWGLLLQLPSVVVAVASAVKLITQVNQLACGAHTKAPLDHLCSRQCSSINRFGNQKLPSVADHDRLGIYPPPPTHFTPLRATKSNSMHGKRPMRVSMHVHMCKPYMCM